MPPLHPILRPSKPLLSQSHCLMRQQSALPPYLQSSLRHVRPFPFTHSFSTTSPVFARKKQGPKKDQRISIIRYHLQHSRNPRPLRFSRSRHLRHWTIHRAWQLFRAQQRSAQQLELERQYNSMRAACEALRLIGEDGLTIAEDPLGRSLGSVKRNTIEVRDGLDLKAAAERQREVGKLFRIAMMKTREGVPIEYARSQTETPPRAGWDHGWTR